MVRTPFEILIDGQDVTAVPNLKPSQYQPRGNTPLLDAVGMIIGRIDSEILARADTGMPIEDQVVVIVTDGYENASREFGLRMVADLIAARRTRAWTFVFLAADERTVQYGVRLGMARGSATRWEPSKKGSREMFSKLGKETVSIDVQQEQKHQVDEIPRRRAMKVKGAESQRGWRAAQYSRSGERTPISAKDRRALFAIVVEGEPCRA